MASKKELTNGKYVDDQMGNGIPEGGRVGQVLKKISDTDYDVDWGTVLGGGSQNLQQVTDIGNITTNDIYVNSLWLWDATNTDYGNLYFQNSAFYIQNNIQYIFAVENTKLSFYNGIYKSDISSSFLNADRVYNLPNAGGTIPLTVNGNTADTNGNITLTAGTGTVTGTGTTNYVSKWSSSTALTNSLIYDNGTNVLIGTNTDDGSGAKLQITGNIRATGYKIPSGTATQFLMANGSVTTGNGGVYTYEIHVSQIDGNNTTGTGSVLNPVASIEKALTLVDSQRKTIIVHPGTYTESPNITVQYTVLTSLQNIGGNTLISGTVSTNTGCTISGLKMTNLTVTGVAGTGNINILNCDISGTLSKSGTADYVLIRFCDIGNPQAGTGGLNVTSSAGLTAVFGGNPNFINVNNAGARVLVKNATTAASVLLAGSLTFADSIILALATQWVTGTTYAVGSLAYNLGFTYVRIVAGAGSTAPASDPTNWLLQSSLNGIDTRNAITTAIGSVVTIANSQIIVPTFQNVARVYFGGIYSELNTVYDRPNSTLSAYATSGGFQVSGSTNSIIYSQFMNADKFIKQGGTSAQLLAANGDSITAGTNITISGGTISTSSSVYQNEIHVSQLDGDDTTGNGELLNPVATISHALTLVVGTRKTIVIHTGTYTESPSITVRGTILTTYCPAFALVGDDTTRIAGTVSTSVNCTISGVEMQNLNITTPSGLGNVNIVNSSIYGTLTKSSNADYTLFRFCDIATGNITGGGIVAIFGGNPSYVTVNNATAGVIIKAASVISPVLTLGSMQLVDCIAIAAPSATYVYTTAAGTVTAITNTQFLNSGLTFTSPISLGGNYQIYNCIYNRTASSFTGTSLNAVTQFQYINADRFVTQGGTASQFVKGNGTLDSSTMVNSITATSPITVTTGSTPVISTSMATNRLIGRSTTGTGVMEQITVGSGLTLSGGTLTNTATITGAATTIVSSDLTISRALISNSSGKVAVSAVTDTELGYISGVTSSIQTQIGTKQASSTNLTSLSGLSYASTSFVKMTAAGTFALDTNTYLTSIADASTTVRGVITTGAQTMVGNKTFTTGNQVAGWGVIGISDNNDTEENYAGVKGQGLQSSKGVWGDSIDGIGVYATSTNSVGLVARGSSGSYNAVFGPFDDFSTTYITRSGKVLIGTNVNNNLDALQVNGTIKANNVKSIMLGATSPTNNTTTLSSTGLQTGTLLAGNIYRFYALIAYSSAATTTGARFTITGSAAATSLNFSMTQTLTATTQQYNAGSAYNIPASATATSLLVGNTCIIQGIITPSADLQLQIQFASEIASSTITVLRGSSLEWW